MSRERCGKPKSLAAAIEEERKQIFLRLGRSVKNFFSTKSFWMGSRNLVLIFRKKKWAESMAWLSLMEKLSTIKTFHLDGAHTGSRCRSQKWEFLSLAFNLILQSQFGVCRQRHHYYTSFWEYDFLNFRHAGIGCYFSFELNFKRVEQWHSLNEPHAQAWESHNLHGDHTTCVGITQLV